MRRSLGLGVYLLYARFLRRALFWKKSDRLQLAATPRPGGALVWLHVVTAGEVPAALELMQRFLSDNPAFNCLVTTSGDEARRAVLRNLRPRMKLAQTPCEALPNIEKFLDHWRPDMLVWTEGGYRPALLAATKSRGIPMLLVNARMSPRSFNRWKNVRGLIGSVLGRFDRILVQDSVTEGHFRMLAIPRSRIDVTGALRAGSAPLPYDEEERRKLALTLGGRPVWLAAMTHRGEEEQLLEVFRKVRRAYPGLLLILVPHEPARGEALAKMVQDAGWTLAQRSKGGLLNDHVDVYLADTHGEMGLWYRLAPVSFLGGSLVAYGGHNPYEPTALGSAILHGPHVSEYAAAYATLAEAGACVEVGDVETLTAELAKALAPERAAELATAAWIIGSEGAEITDKVLEAMQAFAPQNGD